MLNSFVVASVKQILHIQHERSPWGQRRSRSSRGLEKSAKKPFLDDTLAVAIVLLSVTLVTVGTCTNCEAIHHACVKCIAQSIPTFLMVSYLNKSFDRFPCGRCHTLHVT